jgi:DNA modification methylase
LFVETRSFGTISDFETGLLQIDDHSMIASTKERGSKHPTVKPLSLMRYLCKLITPPGGTILDPFAGSGTTGEAAVLEGFHPILIEREAEYLIDIENRMAAVTVEEPEMLPPVEMLPMARTVTSLDALFVD